MGKELKATFAFLCLHEQENKRPDRNQIQLLVQQILEFAQCREYSFSKVFLYLEQSESGPIPLKNPLRIGSFDVMTAQLTKREIYEKLDAKLEEEEKAKKIPGHQSYEPSPIIMTDTCIVVLGSQRFGSAVARAHMVEIGQLLPKLVQILDWMCGLKPYTGKGQIEPPDFTLFSVRPDRPQNEAKGDELTYNFRFNYDQWFSKAPRVHHDLTELLARRK